MYIMHQKISLQFAYVFNMYIMHQKISFQFAYVFNMYIMYLTITYFRFRFAVARQLFQELLLNSNLWLNRVDFSL